MVCRSHSISSSVCHDGHTLPDIRKRKWGTWTCSIILLNVSIVPVLISRCADKDNVLQQQYCVAWLFIESPFYFCASVFLKKKQTCPVQCELTANAMSCNFCTHLYLTENVTKTTSFQVLNPRNVTAEEYKATLFQKYLDGAVYTMVLHHRFSSRDSSSPWQQRGWIAFLFLLHIWFHLLNRLEPPLCYSLFNNTVSILCAMYGQAGQFSNCTLLLWSHAFVIVAECDLALSCWNKQDLKNGAALAVYGSPKPASIWTVCW